MLHSEMLVIPGAKMNPDPMPRVELSPDRRQMTILTDTPAGISRMVLQRASDQDPFTAGDVRRALAQAKPALTMEGQRNTTRRWVTPYGTVYTHVMLGPPTWWLPRIEVRRGALMAGWLRAAVAVGLRRREGP